MRITRTAGETTPDLTKTRSYELICIIICRMKTRGATMDDDDLNSLENNPRPYRDAEFRRDLYRHMLEEV
jgi:hypothetical protein